MKLLAVALLLVFGLLYLGANSGRETFVKEVHQACNLSKRDPRFCACLSEGLEQRIDFTTGGHLVSMDSTARKHLVLLISADPNAIHAATLNGSEQDQTLARKILSAYAACERPSG